MSSSKTNIKPRNLIAKDLRSPKYRMRVAACKKGYNRKSDKQSVYKEISYAYK
jgi:hypothetical protein